ncbi:protein-L-isoaspartate(D-aspartate) O-methyltransferase [Pelagibius marinus]|uniref:protein-L-isoaspartate(D-aspartate) O-methyltransferase n=1 Tax=Pelagibius marinus TaxID=2762760 RepID=UPI001872B04E|nr:protein-L-isoaspartate(D-aspartate) O-methyltransferase [Pelagibius marinus]
MAEDRKAADRAKERAEMLRLIDAEVEETAHWLGKDKLDPRVHEALARTPRHAFVPMMEEAYAYENQPLPIGLGQTISQPYIVAIMTDQANVGPGSRVLEVGTGSGYQAAVLAELGCEVWSIEALPELAEESAKRLKELGYGKVHCRQGDGAKGWPEAAPFDAILVTAAATAIPPALVDQLKRGGRMILPLGPPDGAFRFTSTQRLLRIEKAEDGSLAEEVILPVAFVPLVSPPEDDAPDEDGDED